MERILGERAGQFSRSPISDTYLEFSAGVLLGCWIEFLKAKDVPHTIIAIRRPSKFMGLAA
jgi:hypothetical protein